MVFIWHGPFKIKDICVEFDRKRLKILPLAERENKMTLTDIKKLEDSLSDVKIDETTKIDIEILAERID